MIPGPRNVHRRAVNAPHSTDTGKDGTPCTKPIPMQCCTKMCLEIAQQVRNPYDLRGDGYTCTALIGDDVRSSKPRYLAIHLTSLVVDVSQCVTRTHTFTKTAQSYDAGHRTAPDARLAALHAFSAAPAPGLLGSSAHVCSARCAGAQSPPSMLHWVHSQEKRITDHANPEGNGLQHSKERGRRGSTGPPQPERQRQKHRRDPLAGVQH